MPACHRVAAASKRVRVSLRKTLKDLGVTHVWLTGCLRQATLTGYPDAGCRQTIPM
jgi:hypothetical protein